MNKYLLLRDNKQSGPYTVPEIISKGIKPYDLVWLDGKSAAWRYPSEIEELKAYSPVVEEQPFDRFYKKPEFSIPSVTESIVRSSEETSRFEPKITEPAKKAEPIPVELPAIARDNSVPKKVYINFPGSNPGVSKQEKTEQPIAATYEAPVPNINYQKTQTVSPGYLKEEFPNEKFHNNITPTYTRKEEPNRKILFAVIAACFVLVMVIGVMVVNYFNQRTNLNNLNTLVAQMEQRQKQSQQVIPAVEVKQQEAPPVIVQAPAEIPAAAVDMNVAANTPPKATKRTIKDQPDDHSVIFTEKKPVDISRTAQDPAAVENPVKPIAPKTGSNENLFKLVSVKSNKFKTGLLGGISNLQLELTNNSQQELYKVAVEIKFLGPEKKVVKTQTVYFENVSPGRQTTIDVPRSNRGVTIDYTITDIKS